MATMPRLTRFIPRNRQQRLLVGVGALVLVAILFLSLAYESGWGEQDGGDGGTPPAPRVPPYVMEDGANYAVQDAFQGSNEPSIAVSLTDPSNMVGGSNDYATPTSDAWVGYYWTFDGGKRWEKGLIPGYPNGPVSALTGFEAAGDPVVAAGPGGEFYFSGIAFKRTVPNLGRSSSIFVAKSTDGGRTFGQVSMVAQSLTQATFHDKEWLACDPNTGNVYVSWTMFNGPESSIMFSRSTDGGRTFSRPWTLLSDIRAREFQTQGSQVVVARDGTVHVTWIEFATDTEGVHRYTRSTDGGQTFSDVVDIGPVTYITSPLPNGGYRTPTLPSLAVDNTGGSYDGSVYIAWNDMREGNADAFLMGSHDAGATWGEQVRVNDDDPNNGADQFFPAVCVGGNGTVCVSFYDRRDDANNTLLKYYMAQSVDGGATFLPNFPLSNVQFDGNAAGGRRKGGVFSGTPFMGDYTAVAAAPDFCIAIWCDTRDGTAEAPNSDIYVARVTYAPLANTH